MYVCSLCIYMFMYAKHRFLEKFYLYMFSGLVHFRLVSFIEKFYIFRKKEEKKGGRRRKSFIYAKVTFLEKFYISS